MPTETKLRSNDQAWSESIIYGARDFNKYNPDDLIGRKGFSIYRKMMLDDQVKAVIIFKRDAVTSRDYIFVPHDNVSGDENDRRINVFTEALQRMNGTFSDALNGIMSSMYNGFSLTEKIFKQIEVEGSTYWGIDSLRVKPYDTFKFKVDEYGNIEELIQELNNKRQELDIRSFIYLVNRPDIDTHYGSSELREAYRDWFSKDATIKFRNIWLEKHATGYRWVEPAEDTDKKLRAGSAEYNAIVDMLNNKTAGSGFILPSGYTMKFEFPSNNVAFNETITACNMAIARCLLVPNLLGISEQGKYGSRALGDDQLEAFFWTLDTLASNLSSALNTQLFEELGDANWGDGEYPRFEFKPVSERRKHEIIEKWTNLVEKGTVRATSRDEDHLRELLEFPQKYEDGEDTSSINSLDAQQINALTDIATKIKSDQIDKQTAILLIMHTLPMNREEAEEFVGSINVIQNPNNSNDDNGNPNNTPDSNDNGDPASVLPISNVSPIKEETLVGKSSKTIIASQGAFTRAMKRVAFAVIAQNTDDIVELNALYLSNAIKQGIDIIFDNVETLDDIDVVKVGFPGKTKTKLRSICNKFLTRGGELGRRHARDELDRARGQRFTRIDYDRLGDSLEELTSARSYDMAGKLSSDTESIIKNEILQGMKGDRTVKEIIKKIYEVLKDKGFMHPETLAQVIEDISTIAAKPHHLMTIVRTGLFEAINQARLDYFTDPSLGDFISAYEFSAILDSRTTHICETMDGRIYPENSEYWTSGEFVPPLHYNCRSLLIAVTIHDEWEKSDSIPDEIEPASGFR